MFFYFLAFYVLCCVFFFQPIERRDICARPSQEWMMRWEVSQGSAVGRLIRLIQCEANCSFYLWLPHVCNWEKLLKLICMLLVCLSWHSENYTAVRTRRSFFSCCELSNKALNIHVIRNKNECICVASPPRASPVSLASHSKLKIS